MKRILAMLLAATMLYALSACGSTNMNSQPDSNSTQENASTSDNEPSSTQPESSETPSSFGSEDTQETEDVADGTNILIAYFSRAGDNYNVGVIEKGNTAIIAEMIAEQTGGNLFHIETVTPYPEDYRECTNVTQQELRDNARPELTAIVEDFDDYDVIFLGYPNWWGDMPMAVYTFMESYDFSGKTIVPFATHEGSGLSSTESSIANTCSSAEVQDGLAILGSVAQNSQEEANEAVINWLSGSGFIQ